MPDFFTRMIRRSDRCFSIWHNFFWHGGKSEKIYGVMHISKREIGTSPFTGKICKLMVSVSFYRTGIHALEDLSCTDKECSWRKAPGKALYGEPVPVKAFCHVRMLPAPLECSTQEKGEILKLLTGACYNSALAKHR